jgi:hypothetical protein
MSLDFTPDEGIDQLLGFPGEPGDHPNSQILGEGSGAAVEAAAQHHADSGGRQALEALRPRDLGDAQPAHAAHFVSVQLGDHELVRRAEPWGHVLSVKRHTQHRSSLLGEVFAGLVPD